MRIFLSFNPKDMASAEALRTGVSKIEPGAQIFFSPSALDGGFWLPRLAHEIACADAFLLLVGPNGLSPWQQVEYFEALDRHVHEKERFPLVPVIAASARAPGLPFLRRLNWVQAPIVTEDKVMHRLLAALKGETVVTATPQWKLVNPYRGLETMTEADADYFFGRTAETTAALTALADKPGRCPILIGASGVGKSSIAQAGVLSALKMMRWPEPEHTAWPQGLQNSREWVLLTMRPGDAPLDALAAAMTRLWQLDAKDPMQGALPRRWAGGLASGDNLLADLISATQEELKRRTGATFERLLLYLDQCEELYTRAPPNDARRFSEVLAEGLRDPRLRAFASLRADYFDRLQADEPLFRCHELVNVLPLDRAHLHEVVTGPARVLGVAFEHHEVANRVTDSAVREPGALPLLSYLLTDMWAEMVQRGEPTLRLPAHLLDVSGVLASRAEEFLNAHPDEEKALRRLLTLRLAIVPLEGEPVRRQTTSDECNDAEWALAARLADHPWRLVVMSERGADVTAEVANEALLRAWPRLSNWLREEREFLVFKGEVEHRERRWREMDQANRALLTGLDLSRAEEWLPIRSQDLSPKVSAFLHRSIAFDHEKTMQSRRFQRRAKIYPIVALLVIAIIGGFGWVQWGLTLRELNKIANVAPPAKIVPPLGTPVVPTPTTLPQPTIPEQIFARINALPQWLQLILVLVGFVALWWSILATLWRLSPQRLVELQETLPDSKTLDQAAEVTDKLTAGLSKAVRVICAAGLLHLGTSKRALHAWVTARVPEARDRFTRLKIVQDRRIALDLPIMLDEMPLDQPWSALDLLFRKPSVSLLICGPGGAGKTTLACQIGRRALGEEGAPLGGASCLPLLIDRNLEMSETGDRFLPFLTGALQALIGIPRLSSRLAEALLRSGRVLVIVDGLSERNDATRRAFDPTRPGFPIMRLIVTSRDAERGRMSSAIEMRTIPRDALYSFISRYIDEANEKKDIVTPLSFHAQALSEAEIYDACAQFKRLLRDKPTTPLFAAMWIEEVMRSGGAAAERISNVAELIDSYVERLLTPAAGGNAVHLENLRLDLMAIASRELADRLTPGWLTRMHVLDALRERMTDGADKRIDILLDSRLIEADSRNSELIRVTLDPIAEHLAVRSRVESMAGDATKWRSFLRLLKRRGWPIAVVDAVRACLEARGYGHETFPVTDTVLQELLDASNRNRFAAKWSTKSDKRLLEPVGSI
jgi:hypothetical protein